MRSAKLLVIAYKAARRGEPAIAKEIFMEAIEDETAPELMERINEDIIKEDQILSEGEEGEEEAGAEEDLEIGEEEAGAEEGAEEDSEEEEVTLSSTQKAKIKAIANQISSKGHKVLARRLLRQIRK
ncbi:MAG: hypothetical protein PHO03_06135 [Candidatus Omnitrophica bacterium]|nr:hypothetical protein [Candidatus Omnitrophota bacterium]